MPKNGHLKHRNTGEGSFCLLDLKKGVIMEKDLFFQENIFEILDYLDEGIHIIDQSGRNVYYNRFALNIDGIKRADVIGKHITDVYPSLDEKSSTLLTAVRRGKPIYKREQTFVNYNGKKITTINTSIPIKSDGKILGAIEISKDITQVKEMSERIVDLQERLIAKQSKKNFTSESIYKFSDIIGSNEEMLSLIDIAKRASETDASVLITGETGTGKELFVHSIHNSSKRRTMPFITQNCAALPTGLLEGLLFGTTKGGFTDAKDRPGLFELAHGGTLFLDEINSMPLELQSKLLRVLQDGNIRRVGGTTTTKVDVRIIAATNVDPQVAIAEKHLRQDLFYRLNVVNINIPPLRQRKDDIKILANYFIEKFNYKLNRYTKGMTDEALEIFESYPWDGNVRELEHIIEAIMSIEDIEIIDLEHIPRKIKSNTRIEDTSKLPLTQILENKEKELIKEALESTDNNISYAAEKLQIPRQTLQYRMKKLKITAQN